MASLDEKLDNELIHRWMINEEFDPVAVDWKMHVCEEVVPSKGDSCSP